MNEHEGAPLRPNWKDVDGMTDAQFRALVMARFDVGTDRMDAMDKAIAENTRITGDIAADTEVIREVVLMGRAFFSGAARVGRGFARMWDLLMPLLRFASFIAATYIALRSALTLHGNAAPPPK